MLKALKIQIGTKNINLKGNEMKKIFLAIALSFSLQSNAGEHLMSHEAVYSYTAVPNSENLRIYSIPDYPETDGWLSFHADMFPAKSPLYVRIAVRDDDTGTLYYYGILKPGDSKDLTFPLMVHSFHKLNVLVKCVNTSDKPMPCKGYFVLYGK